MGYADETTATADGHEAYRPAPGGPPREHNRGTFTPTIESAIAAFCDETGAGGPPRERNRCTAPVQFIR
jgi:hypothetical protein